MNTRPEVTLNSLIQIGIAQAFVDHMYRFWSMPDRTIEEHWRDNVLLAERLRPTYQTIQHMAIPLGAVEYGL